MPSTYDLTLILEGMRADRTATLGPLGTDAQTDVATRLKHVAIGDLVEHHRATPGTDPTRVLPGHLHLHRIAVLGGRRTAATTLELTVRLTLLSDVPRRREVLLGHIRELEITPTRLPRSDAWMSLRRWAPVADEPWANVLASHPNDGTATYNGVINGVAILRRRQQWKTPTLLALLDAASWNFRRMCTGDGWITAQALRPPDSNCGELITINPGSSTLRMVNATELASAATKKSESHVNGLAGAFQLRLSDDPIAQAAAHCWLRIFAWTGLGSYGGTGAGHLSQRTAFGANRRLHNAEPVGWPSHPSDLI